MARDSVVAVSQCGSVKYPPTPPFHPPDLYPEFSAGGGAVATDPANEVYAAVRESFRLLELDAGNFGTTRWNPLRDVVVPGNHVLIKPNWVCEGHHLDGSWEQVITHGAVLRAVLDYVRLALDGRGRISLADGPMLSSNFAEITRKSGIDQVAEWFVRGGHGVELRLLDLRDTFLETRDDVVIRRHPLPGDPLGGVVINLGRMSLFYGFRGEGRYYGADYDTEEVNAHHRGDVQEYRLSGSAIDADVLVDVPKLKTHQKVGVTLTLKGVVGLNSGRNWLPHRTQGTPDQGGDQFAESTWRQSVELVFVRTFEQASLRIPHVMPTLYRFAKRAGRKIFGATHRTIRGGAWHGNDTLWRMALDINRALMYADEEGKVHEQPKRRRFSVIDGIVAGEGNGPIYPDSRACGLIIAGHNPVAVDIVGAEIMGFDHQQIPMLARACLPHPLPLLTFDPDAIDVVSNVSEWSGGLNVIRNAAPFAFDAPQGWKGKLEAREASHGRR